MTELADILKAANVRHALIVDDAFDTIPLASDLSTLDADEWTHFFDDLSEDDIAIMGEIFADYGSSRADELQRSNSFVKALWDSRTRFRPELIDPLFSRYDADSATDRRYLDTLIGRLESYGLTHSTTGRQFQDEAAVADLIIIDLFLGSEQNEAAINASIEGLKAVVAARPLRPPLVILMSRSSRLEAKRKDFRDKSGLFESAFRFIQKSDLADQSNLEGALAVLASHYVESLKLAAFLNAWQIGLDKAGNRTISVIRTLDLTDYAQLRLLLLNAEGEPTGSYLVDVFDRVLQHEIEAEAAIIDAAIDLNTLTTDTYPAPYIAGSRDLQDLVYRSLFQHRERLRLWGAEGSRVAFGDLMRRKTRIADPQRDMALTQVILPDVGGSDVLAVLTPACDLQREGAKRILLLVGTLKPLGPTDWVYAKDPIRTPIIELGHPNRFWIKWDLKHIETVSHAELGQVLDDPAGFEIIARLRESHALEIQQLLLSNLGRIGQIAPMPATFPVKVAAYLPDHEKKPVIPVAPLTDGVCHIGRGGPKEMRLTLPEDACKAICKGIEAVDLQSIHADARNAVEYLRTSGDLMSALIKGLTLPISTTDFKDMPSPSEVPDGANDRPRTIGLISRNKPMDGVIIRDVRKAGIIITAFGDSGIDEEPG